MIDPFGSSAPNVDSPFRLEALSEAHDRAAFRCGVETLDRYFREHATQDIRRRMSNCFVAVERTTGDVAGFYTLATSGVSNTELPPSITKRLPRYQLIPAIQVGRLAVDLRYRGRDVGAGLLADAVFRSAHADPAAFTLLVDAKGRRCRCLLPQTWLRTHGKSSIDAILANRHGTQIVFLILGP